MKHYEIIEHTADTGLRVRGRDLKELYSHAAQGLLELAFDTQNINERETKSVTVNGADAEELLVNWLQELLYLFEVKHFIAKRAVIDSLNELTLQATVYGELFNTDRHAIKEVIKGVAYHQLKIEKHNNEYTVQIIVDV